MDTMETDALARLLRQIQEIEEQREEIENEREEIGSQREEIERQYKEIKHEREDIDCQHAATERKYEDLERQREDLDCQREEIKRQCEEIERQLSEAEHGHEDIELQYEEVDCQREEIKRQDEEIESLCVEIDYEHDEVEFQYEEIERRRKKVDYDRENIERHHEEIERRRKEVDHQHEEAKRRYEEEQHRREKGQQQQVKQKIKDRPYCTAQCLLGLANGGSMDKDCPNFQDHGHQHLDRLEFLRLVPIQIATDRGRDADTEALFLSGAVGSLFKVRLSSHGYTLVAKGVEGHYLERLQHENEVYDRLAPIQGKHIPVCLGTVDLDLPLFCDGGVYLHLLFLSWAGWPLFALGNKVEIKADAIDVVAKSYRELHKLGVVHNDAEIRNLSRDPETGTIMVVDFERAKLVHNKKRRKREGEGAKSEYAKELDHITECLSRQIAGLGLGM